MKKILKYELFEKTMARTMHHLNKDEFVVMTSWRGSLPTKVNMQRIKDLELDLDNRHLGFIDMRGVGQEESGPSVEKSMMVISDGREDFLDSMLSLAVKYEQDFILYGKDGVAKLIDQEGNVVQTFHGVEKGEAAYYSALDKHKDRKFHLVESESYDEFKEHLRYHFLKAEYKRDRKGTDVYPDTYKMPKDLKGKIFFVENDMGYEYEVTFMDNEGGFKYRMIHPFYQKPFDK